MVFLTLESLKELRRNGPPPGGTRAGLRAEQRVTQGAERGTVIRCGDDWGNQGKVSDGW